MKLTDSEKEMVESDFCSFIQKVDDATIRIQTARSINNALMDFASLIDLKNPENIDWSSYPILSGVFYETR